MSTTITFQSPATDSISDSSGTTGSGGDVYGTKSKSTGDVSIEIMVWSIGGKVVYAPNLTNMTFTGSDAAIDGMGTMDLLNLIAQVSIGQGYAHSYTTCSGTCGTNSVKVIYPACVSRVGTGVGTHFELCGGDGCCIRTYAFCCPDGSDSPNIRLIGSSSSTTCGGTGASGAACVSTCP